MSSGHYEYDDVRACIFGVYAVLIGFDNGSFRAAVLDQQIDEGMGKRFEAFIIPEKCSVVTHTNPTIEMKRITP